MHIETQFSIADSNACRDTYHGILAPQYMQKAFDSIERERLWGILWAYGVPQKIIQLIKNVLKAFTCCVEGVTSALKSKQALGKVAWCLLCHSTWSLIIWVMHHSTEDQPRGILWTLFSTSEDLDFADDIVLLSCTDCHIQLKTSILNTYTHQ